MSQVELARAFRAGELSATAYVSDIEAHFISREPSVQAFIPEAGRFDRLGKEAEALVKRFSHPESRPPLFGVLVGVKDIFHAEGFTTRAGSCLPAEELQGVEAETVTRLKGAGALILGKTVTTEFAYFSPGPTRNPHNPEHTPGGSSSGSAAAVAAGLCGLALGTQTIGSIIRPASFCGAVGFKPTYGRISRAGVIPLSPALDHVGFFTPSVKEAINAARVLYENWAEANRSSNKPVLGVPDGPYLESASEEGRTHFERTCDRLGTHYKIQHFAVMSDFQEIRARQDVILSAEAAQVHKTWFAKYEPLYSAKFTELVRRGQSISRAKLQDALEARDRFCAEMAETMNHNDIDFWICPSTLGSAPKGLDSTGDPVMNLPWTQIGFPAINLPSGKNAQGLPLGLQVVGKRDADASLLACSQDIEKAVSSL